MLESQMASTISFLSENDLKPLEEVDKMNQTSPKYSAFGDLCLHSILF